MIQETIYFVGQDVAELKPHLTPDGKNCDIRRGKIKNVEKNSYTESATIECECGSEVKEGV